MIDPEVTDAAILDVRLEGETAFFIADRLYTLGETVRTPPRNARRLQADRRFRPGLGLPPVNYRKGTLHALFQLADQAEVPDLVRSFQPDRKERP